MKTLADRYRRWYEYEKGCNALALEMLASVPVDRREDPRFARAVGRMAHLVAARLRWLHRLGRWPDLPPIFPQDVGLDELAGQVAATEAAWTEFLADLDDESLSRPIEWAFPDGKRYRWDVEGLLTQMFIHAPYHRGQIAQSVQELGGRAVDTDYIFWCKLVPIETAI
ncbi:MAG: DinB family protein [Isosphaeraceae bacterium]